MKEIKNLHKPVLMEEVLEYLHPQQDQWYLDATLGDAGHTLELLKHNSSVLGLDQDPKALERSQKIIANQLPDKDIQVLTKLKKNDKSADCLLLEGNFSNLKELTSKLGFESFSGILFDLGVSTHQILSEQRGFSFQSDAPLDMRMNPDLSVSAADLVNGLRTAELKNLFRTLGDEPFAKPIAEKIVGTRKEKPIKTTKELAYLVESVKHRSGRLHPATKVFQALRMAVNSERENLTQALPQAVDLLKKDAKLVVISFHAGEDRIVKQFFKNSSQLKILTKKPITPSTSEIKYNPRSRSAKLRVAQKK